MEFLNFCTVFDSYGIITCGGEHSFFWFLKGIIQIYIFTYQVKFFRKACMFKNFIFG